MGDVLAFLAAVHAADEQDARAATTGPWRWARFWCNAPERHNVDCEGVDELVQDTTGDPMRMPGNVLKVDHSSWVPTDADAVHIASHDPQSVLARVQAERALVAMHEPVDLPPGPYGIPANTFCRACADGGMPVQDERGTGWALWPCPSLRVLAWGYRYREGFDPAWTPDGMEVEA